MQNIESKPFWKSSGTIVSGLALIVTLGGSMMGKLPPETAAYIMAGLGAVYMLARGVGKIGAAHDSSKKPFYLTSEFGVMVLGVAGTLVGWLSDAIGPEKAAQISGAITMIYTMVRRMSKVGDPNEDLHKKSMAEMMELIKKEGGKALMILCMLFSFSAMTACSTFLGDDNDPPIPFATYVQYFNAIDGEAARLHDLINQAEAKGVISEVKARSLRNRLDAQVDQTDTIVRGQYKGVDLTQEAPKTNSVSP